MARAIPHFLHQEAPVVVPNSNLEHSSRYETQRLEALREYGLLDTLPEPALDDLTALASEICKTPISLISLVDKDRQWFKSKRGLEASQTSRDVSFCAHALHQPGLLVVPDATLDNRFAQNADVTGGPRIRFYAGAPLITDDGYTLGTLCVLDRVPRRLTETQLEALRMLGRQVMAQLQLRQHTRELVESEARLFKVFRDCRVGMALTRESDRTFVQVNEAFAELVGWTRREIIGRSMAELHLAEIWDLGFASDLAGEKNGHHGLESAIRTKLGEARHVLADVVKVSLRGKPHLITTFVDITERKQAEESVRLMNERFQFATRATKDVVWDWDLGTNELWWNDSFQTTFGYSAAEIEPTIESWVSRLHPAELAKVKDGIDALISGMGTSWTEEYRFRRKDGTYAEILDRGYVIRDPAGRAVRMVGAMVDMTERNRVYQHMGLLDTCIANLNDIILVVESEPLEEPGPRIVFVNSAFERITGYTIAETLGRSPRFLYGSNTDPAVLEKIDQALNEKRPFRTQLINYKKDGTPYWLEMDLVPICTPNGMCTHFVAIERDITEKKRIEEQFMRARRMESIGSLAGGVAHDLNNILAPIILSIELLQRTIGSENSQNILKTIELSAKRGAEIVRQILSFARGLEGERMDIPPRRLLEELEGIIRETFPKSIQLQFSIPGDAWTIRADPTQMHQVLLNLCVNARDAMPSGGALTIQVENRLLDKQYAAVELEAEAGRYIMISVTDSGEGIPPKLVGRIFEPFFTTKDLNLGTGLGLSTVLAIVKSHGGAINVRSDSRQGTTFEIFIPATDDDLRSSVALPELAGPPRGNGETVMIVDDETSILAVTSETLQAFGYRVLTTTEGAQAIAMYAERGSEIAVVMIDMMMPGMDGPATIDALRRLDPTIKIIAASGFASLAGSAKASAASVKHFMAKPYTAGTLLATLRQIIDSP